jgi:hypothetical protein
LLSRELMGAFALGVLWTGTLLVLLASARDVRRWFRLWRRMRPLPAAGSGVGLIAARVVEGSGPIARHTVVQTGRWAAVPDGGPRAIIFHDREYRSEILGGTVETLDGSRRIDIAATEEGQVWAPGKPQVIDPELSFEQAYARSKHVRGFPRDLRTELGAGVPLWLVGAVKQDGDHWSMGSPPGGQLIASTVDPRKLSSQRIRLGLGVMALMFLIGAAATALAVWPPAFGGRSIAGGVLCLAFFLIMQPVGTWLRDRLRSPASAIVRGTLVDDPSPAVSENPALKHG